jgi:membrane fusion protein
VTAQLVGVDTLVRKGDPLVVVSSEITTSSDVAVLASVVAMVEAKIASLKDQQNRETELLALGLDDLAAKRESKKELVRQIDLQVVDSSARVELRRRSLDRYKALESFFSGAQVEQQAEALLEQEEAHKTLLRLRNEAAAEVAHLDRSLRSYPIIAAQKKATAARELAAAQAELAELEGRREVVVRAPADGRIASIHLGLGQPVGTGNVILTLIPLNSELAAEIELPDYAVGQVRPGSRALLRIDAFPYVRYGEVEAEVMVVSADPQATRISSSPGRSFLAIARIDRQQLNVDGAARPLMSGMRFVAVVRSDRRPLWQWLLQPFLREGAR